MLGVKLYRMYVYKHTGWNSTKICSFSLEAISDPFLLCLLSGNRNCASKTIELIARNYDLIAIMKIKVIDN